MRRWTIDMVRMAGGAALMLPGALQFHRRRQGEGGRRVAIFYSHRVYLSDEQPIYQLGIEHRLFRRQMIDLQRFYRFVPLLDALDQAGQGRDGEDLACLTFDDGYRDNYTVAHPILRELGIPATIFLVAGLIGTTQRFWFDELKVIVETAPGPSLRVPGVIGGDELDLRDVAHRRAALTELLRRMKECEDRTRRVAVRELVQLHQGFVAAEGSRNTSAPVPEPDRDALLSWEEVRVMEEEGARFGSHTLSHPLLSRISDEGTLRAELNESREILSARLKDPLPVLAYPGGAWSDAVVRATGACGYKWGLANFPGWLRRDIDPMLIPRRGVGPRSSLFAGSRHSRTILRAESEGLFDRARRRVSAVDARTRVAAVFDEKAEAYLRNRREDPAFAGEERQILSLLRCPPTRMIDVGSGAGITAIHLAQSGFRVVAADISLEMLRRARTLAGREGVADRIGLVRCDIQNLPFRPGCISVVLCHGVLEYVPDVPRALLGLRQLLNPGGFLIATVPNRLAPSSLVGSVLSRLATIRAKLRGRTLERVPARHRLPWKFDSMARAAGLSKEEGIIQTFAPVPPYLISRSWLRWNNRLVEGLPRTMLFRWWGTQYIARYGRIAPEPSGGTSEGETGSAAAKR